MDGQCGYLCNFGGEAAQDVRVFGGELDLCGDWWRRVVARVMKHCLIPFGFCIPLENSVGQFWFESR